MAAAENGTRRWALGEGQSQATAVLTAVAARTVHRLLPGVHHLHQVMTFADLSARGDARIRVQ